MQLADFNRLLTDPAMPARADMEGLQKLSEEFPYFQAAHLLLTLAAKKYDASVYQNSLRKTAILCTNRTRLFELVQKAEQATVDIIAKDAAVVMPAVTPAEQVQEELTVLKAAELSTETVSQLADVQATKDKIVTANENVPAEDILEKEIGKNVVTAFVEREILDTPALHKPVAREEPESFGDWLAFLKKNNGQPYQEISEQVEKEKARVRAKNESEKGSVKPKAEKETEVQPDRKSRNMALIDKIIEKNPGLIRSKEDQKFFAPDHKAKESLLENEHLVTETLARIYAMQGSVNKAIRAYEILSLKYPQKSAYFASLIEKLRNNQ